MELSFHGIKWLTVSQVFLGYCASSAALDKLPVLSLVASFARNFVCHILISADFCQARQFLMSPEGLALGLWSQAGLSIPEHLKQHDPPSPSTTDNFCKWEKIWAVLPPLIQSILLQMLTWPYVQHFSWEILKHLGSLCKSRAVSHSSYILTVPCLDEFVGHCARFCPHAGPWVLSLFVR